MKASVSKRVTFNAAHRLNNPKWDAETNQRVFGLCNNPNYHGHNYVLIVKVKGEINSDTGYVIDMKELKDVIHENIVDRFDHRNLNLDIPEFADLNPTAENIAVVIWNSLRKKIDSKLDLIIDLYETERNFVEYAGE